jgi:hypothetical protein
MVEKVVWRDMKACHFVNSPLDNDIVADSLLLLHDIVRHCKRES